MPEFSDYTSQNNLYKVAISTQKICARRHFLNHFKWYLQTIIFCLFPSSLVSWFNKTAYHLWANAYKYYIQILFHRYNKNKKNFFHVFAQISQLVSCFQLTYSLKYNMEKEFYRYMSMTLSMLRGHVHSIIPFIHPMQTWDQSKIDHPKSSRSGQSKISHPKLGQSNIIILKRPS